MEELKKKIDKAMKCKFIGIEKLKKYGKKTITKTDLEALFAVSSDEELFEMKSKSCAQSKIQKQTEIDCIPFI